MYIIKDPLLEKSFEHQTKFDMKVVGSLTIGQQKSGLVINYNQSLKKLADLKVAKKSEGSLYLSWFCLLGSDTKSYVCSGDFYPVDEDELHYQINHEYAKMSIMVPRPDKRSIEFCVGMPLWEWNSKTYVWEETVTKSICHLRIPWDMILCSYHDEFGEEALMNLVSFFQKDCGGNYDFSPTIKGLGFLLGLVTNTIL